MVDWIKDNLPAIFGTLGIASIIMTAIRYAWSRFTRRHERMDIERRTELIASIKQLISVRKELKSDNQQDSIVFHAYYSATMTNELLKLSKELNAKTYRKLSHYALQSTLIVSALFFSLLSVFLFEAIETILWKTIVFSIGLVATLFLILLASVNSENKKLVSQIISSSLMNATSEDDVRKIVKDALTGKKFTKQVDGFILGNIFGQHEPNEHYKEYIDNQS